MGRKKRTENFADKRAEIKYNPYDKGQMEQLLPKLGDHLYRTPAFMEDEHHRNRHRRECVVIAVNTQAHWYRVRFVDTGLCQCIRVPEV